MEGPLHYSFDYAQNVLIPHNTQQVGTIYFKTPRKYILLEIMQSSNLSRLTISLTKNYVRVKEQMKQLATCIILDNCQIKSNQLNFLSVGKNKNNVIQGFNKKK